jgi:hypothetical protein
VTALPSEPTDEELYTTFQTAADIGQGYANDTFAAVTAGRRALFRAGIEAERARVTTEQKRRRPRLSEPEAEYAYNAVRAIRWGGPVAESAAAKLGQMFGPKG